MKPDRKLVIYETTHHETLPALLDLSEAHFSKVTVFLKELSYHNICGLEDPAERWPGTEFFIQTDPGANRPFIHQVFSFLQKNKYSHFHISTLENNLLLFALRLYVLKKVHISLTVHEVNEYFTYRFRNVRDITESIAKKILHRRIRHYTFFLPAMVSLFRQRLPGAEAVFIPSRFYTSAIVSGKNGNIPFRIVIPGSVDPGRRDYDFVAEFFHYFFSRGGARGKIELEILGNSHTTPDGPDIIGKLKKLESPFFQLSFYTTYVPEPVYEQRLSEADLLWSPLKVNKASIRNNPEVYGLTTASGLTADLLLQCTPALVPGDFTIPEPFRSALFPYHSREELGSILDKFIHAPVYLQDCRTSIHRAFSFFAKENFKPAFEKLMRPKIE